MNRNRKGKKEKGKQVKKENKKRTSSTRNITKELKRKPRFLNLRAKAILRLILCVLSATCRILMKRMPPGLLVGPVIIGIIMNVHPGEAI